MKTQLEQLLEWCNSFDEGNIKPTHTNMKEKIWQLMSVKQDTLPVWVKGNYERLYNLVEIGEEVVCWVDCLFDHKNSLCRDICTIRNGNWCFQARGVGYSKFYEKPESIEDFVKECERLDVEWLNESPTPQAEILKEVFENNPVDALTASTLLNLSEDQRNELIANLMGKSEKYKQPTPTEGGIESIAETFFSKNPCGNFSLFTAFIEGYKASLNK